MSTNEIILLVSEYLGVIAVMLIFKTLPRFQLKTVGFRFPRREGLISLSLYALILVFAFIFNRPGIFNLQIEGNLASPAMNDAFRALVIGAISVVIFIVALIVRRQPLRSIGWDKEGLKTALMIGLLLVFLTIFLRGKIFAILNGVTPAEGLGLLLWAGIALAEETIFRGYIQLRLVSFWGETYGWILTAVLYTLWKVPWNANGLELNALLMNMGLTLIQGLMLGWIMRRSNHVLAPVMYRAISGWLYLI